MPLNQKSGPMFKLLDKFIHNIKNFFKMLLGKPNNKESAPPDDFYPFF